MEQRLSEDSSGQVAKHQKKVLTGAKHSLAALDFAQRLVLQQSPSLSEEVGGPSKSKAREGGSFARGCLPLQVCDSST